MLCSEGFSDLVVGLLADLSTEDSHHQSALEYKKIIYKLLGPFPMGRGRE